MVSVIIPNYNKGPFISRALKSVIHQTDKNWEAIVVDDCSTDDSWATIQDYTRMDDRFRAVRNETNRGGCYSRNVGAGMAQGEFLIFLDSDDWLADDCLEQRVREFSDAANADVEMIVFPMGTVKDGCQTGIWKSDCGDALMHILRHNIPWQTMMPIWRRKAFERVGGFDESFPRLQDVELHTRALLMGVAYRIARRTTPDCFYFIEEGRMTTDHERAIERSVRGMLMYVAKMTKLIPSRRHRHALEGTLLAAIRTTGDAWQAGKISTAFRDEIYEKVVSASDRARWVVFYAWLYRHKINQLKGVNFIYGELHQLAGAIK